MWKAASVAVLAVAFAGAASAQSNLAPAPSASEYRQGGSAYDQSRNPSRNLRGGQVDLNNNSATGQPRGRTEQRSGSTMPQRLGPIAPGTGAHDRGPPDSSTYNPGTPAIR